MGDLAGAIGDIVGAGITAYGSTQAAKTAAGAARSGIRDNSLRSIALRNRDILANRRDPFTQTAGTSLLSRFTNLNAQQSSDIIQGFAGVSSPAAETGKLPLNFPGGAKGKRGTKGFDFRDVAGDAPVLLEGTDVVTQQQLASLRGQEASAASGLIARQAQDVNQSLASRGLLGTVAPGSLFGSSQRDIFSDISQRAGDRNVSAGIANRKSFLDIVNLFDQFGEGFAGTFT